MLDAKFYMLMLHTPPDSVAIVWDENGQIPVFASKEQAEAYIAKCGAFRDGRCLVVATVGFRPLDELQPKGGA